MATTLFGEFILLFQMACVIFLFAYLFSKSRFYGDLLNHRASLALQTGLAVAFGLLSVYGMNTGISFYTANVNIRDFGPIVAGFACGPFVGAGAGIIGLAYRLSMGGTNVYAVALGPLIAGIIGGLAYHHNNRELVSVKMAVLITFITETVISAFALAVRIIMGDPVQTVVTVGVEVALPMIIMTTFAAAVFCYILHNEIRERRVSTEKNHLELEIESKRNLNVIINTIAYPVYVIGRDHRFILVNDSMCRFLGREREGILGKTPRDFYSRTDADRHWVMVETAFQTHAHREEEVTIQLPGGQDCTFLSTSAMYTAASGQEFLVGVIHDITERRKMEDALKDLNARLHRAEQVAQLGHWEFLMDTGKVVASEGARTLYDIQGSDITISDVQKISIPECRPMLDAALRQLMEEGKPYNVEFMIRRRSDNATVFIHSIAEYNRDSNRVFGVIQDITERKRVEKSLRIVTKKLNLLSSVTRHDLINQLMVLKGFLTLAKSMAANPEQNEFIDKARQISDTMERQIRFTRDYEAIGVKAPEWESVSMNLIHAKGMLNLGEVELIQDCPDLEVYTDPLFEKVFYNLIDNSLKYGKPGLTTIRVTCLKHDTGLSILYEDDGPGISPDDREHLFERGFGKNTGLGLFLIREILALTGITIRATDMEGDGACFEIRVPEGAYRFRQD